MLITTSVVIIVLYRSETERKIVDKKLKPSEAHLEILQILWEHEPTSVAFVHEQIVKKKNVGYTTTLKNLQRMLEKGLIQREGSGKSYQYSAAIQESDIQSRLFDRLLNTAFKGSAMEIVMHALGRSKPSPEELSQLREYLANIKDDDDERTE